MIKQKLILSCVWLAAVVGLLSPLQGVERSNGFNQKTGLSAVTTQTDDEQSFSEKYDDELIETIAVDENDDSMLNHALISELEQKYFEEELLVEEEAARPVQRVEGQG